MLISYDTISVPLVYTQVVTLAVYSFFIASAISSQWYENKTVENDYANMVDLYFPIFATLQFFFYMGWLKVAESLINPFGEDDDDFEINWMIDRNLQVSYMIVDEMHHEHPELIRDQYWDEVFPAELPYTVASQREGPPEPSTATINVKPTDAEMIPVVPSSVKVDDMVGKSLQTVNYTFPSQTEQNENEEQVSASSRFYYNGTLVGNTLFFLLLSHFNLMIVILFGGAFDDFQIGRSLLMSLGYVAISFVWGFLLFRFCAI